KDGIQTFIDFPDEPPLGTAKSHHRRSVLFDHDVNAQRRYGQIRVLLLSFVNAAGSAREDFKEHDRVVLKGVGLWIGPANDRHVRIIKPDLRGEANAYLGVGVERPTGL